MKNEKLSEWAEWGGAVDQSVRLFMMTGARDRLFDAFPMSPIYAVLALWLEHAHWIINDEAWIFVVANGRRSCGLTAYFSLLSCGDHSKK